MFYTISLSNQIRKFNMQDFNIYLYCFLSFGFFPKHFIQNWYCVLFYNTLQANEETS